MDVPKKSGRKVTKISKVVLSFDEHRILYGLEFERLRSNFTMDVSGARTCF